MADLVSTTGRPWVAAAESGDAPSGQSQQALAALEHELVGGRRLLVGAAASAAWLGAGLCFAGALGASADHHASVAVATVALGATLLVLGAWAGLKVLHAGRRVQEAYRHWSSASADPVVPTALPHRQVVFRSHPRLLLGALCLVGAAFACLLVWLGIAPGDPGALGDGRGEVAALGLVAAIAFGVPAGCLIGGEVRAVRGLAGRMVSAAAARRQGSRSGLRAPVPDRRSEADPGSEGT